jgi:hypothetical protein
VNDDRFPQHDVTYADMAFYKAESGQIAAGVQLARRYRTEEGRLVYEPYAVISGLYDVMAGSIRQSIPVVAADVIRTAAHGTRLIIFRSSSSAFMRSRAIQAELEILAFDRAINVSVSHIQRLYRVVADVQRLANDAIERGSTVIAAV